MSEFTPEIELENENFLLVLNIKKDYSNISDLGSRKKEFFKNLKEIIKEFEEAPESLELMEYYD